MWKRIKRVVRSNIGRLQPDPFAFRDLSRGARDEGLATIKAQVVLLERELTRIAGEEASLGERVRAALEGGRREEALGHAQAIARLRDERARLERQLEATRKVADRAAAHPQRASEDPLLAAAAEETLARLERSLTDEGDPVRSKTLGGELGASDRAPERSKTLGGAMSVHAAPTPAREVRKTIGPGPEAALAPAAESAPPTAAPSTAAPRTLGVAPAGEAPASGGLLDELERLGRLKAQGVLSEAEFERAKAKLLEG